MCHQACSEVKDDFCLKVLGILSWNLHLFTSLYMTYTYFNFKYNNSFHDLKQINAVCKWHGK